MIGYYALTAIAPGLDTPAVEAWWVSYWQRGTLRRILPAALTAIMLAGSAVPARAEMPVFDVQGYLQTATDWVKQEWEFLWNDQVTMEDKLKDAALAWSVYKQTRDLYCRLATKNISLSLVDALPTIDIETNDGQNQTFIKPVFVTSQRLPKFAPRLTLGSFNLNNLDFEVDRSTTHSSDPLANMDYGTIKQQAVDDAWQNWELVQKRYGLSTDSQGGINGQLYESLSQDGQQQYQQHGEALMQIVTDTATIYGLESFQYEQAKTEYQDWLVALGSQDATASASIVAALKALDQDAMSEVEAYGTARAAIDMNEKRALAVEDNIKIISRLYNSDPSAPGFSLASFLGVAANVASIGSTLGAMGGGTGPAANTKEPIGQAQKQVALQHGIHDAEVEHLKLAERAELEKSIANMREIAQKKAALLAQLNDSRQQTLTADQARLLALQGRQAVAKLQAQAALVYLPAGCTPVVPANMTGQVPGSVTADQASAAMGKDLGTLSAKALNQGGDNFDAATATMARGLTWGFLGPIFKAIDSGWSAATGQTLNLVDWANGAAQNARNS